jgi:diaminopimelate decarboxylase
VDLIAFAHNNKLEVEGLSFHVGSQCTNPKNYSQALHLAAGIFSQRPRHVASISSSSTLVADFLPTTTTRSLPSGDSPK